jgi:RPA family protein
MDIQPRQIAHIVTIADICDNQYVPQEGWTPDFVLTPWGDKLSRVNIIGTVVDRNEQQIVIDDGTRTIPLRVFDPIPRFSEAKVGDIISCVGKIRDFNNERYILAEHLQMIEQQMLAVRKKQLDLFTDFRKKQEQDHHEKMLDSIEESIAEKKDDDPTPDMIDGMDTGSGVTIQDLIDKGIEQKEIDTLLMNGTIFEIKPGVVKVLK